MVRLSNNSSVRSVYIVGLVTDIYFSCKGYCLFLHHPAFSYSSHHPNNPLLSFTVN